MVGATYNGRELDRQLMAAVDRLWYIGQSARVGPLLALIGVFVLFSVFYLGEAVRWNHLVGFGFIALGAWFIFAQFGARV